MLASRSRERALLRCCCYYYCVGAEFSHCRRVRFMIRGGTRDRTRNLVKLQFFQEWVSSFVRSFAACNCSDIKRNLRWKDDTTASFFSNKTFIGRRGLNHFQQSWCRGERMMRALFKRSPLPIHQLSRVIGHLAEMRHVKNFPISGEGWSKTYITERTLGSEWFVM